MVEIIAIDGPAGSGKSSVSKQVARELGYGYLDTGAAYRALAWAVLRGSVVQLEDNTEQALKSFDYSISLDPYDFWVRVGDQDVTNEIREPRVAEAVSAVAGIPAVRNFMKKLTLELVDHSGFAGVVVEGRDITTVVAPGAKNRILLTAAEEVRLSRRSAELAPEAAKNVERQVSQRDAQDAKVVDFMTPAPGVKLVDSTELNFEQTVSAVLAAVR